MNTPIKKTGIYVDNRLQNIEILNKKKNTPNYLMI